MGENESSVLKHSFKVSYGKNFVQKGDTHLCVWNNRPLLV